MSSRFLASMRAPAAAVIAVVSVAWLPVAGQAPSGAPKATAAAKMKSGPALRTPWGEPDLQGTWTNNSATPLERPKQLAGKAFLTDEEVAALKQRAAELVYAGDDEDGLAGDQVFLAALTNTKPRAGDRGVGLYNQFWFVEREFDNRTSLIVDPSDGRIPPLTPEAQKREAARAEYRQRHPADGPEDIALSQRCITRGMPGGLLVAGYNSYYRISQTPGYVTIHMEMFHDTRIIPLDGRPHVGSAVRSWLGDSRGRWEGDTLVVDTTNFSSNTDFRGSSANLHVVERITRVGPNRVNYELTIDDPTTWTRPWTAMISLKQSQDKIYEFACHEGNYSLRNVLVGARAEERAVTEAPKKESR